MVSCLSLRGFPFIAGFFSKDLVLEGMFEGGVGVMGFRWVVFSCGLTSYYSCRLVKLIMFGEGGSPESRGAEEKAEVLCTSLLGVIRVVGGFLYQCVFLECSFHCEVRAANKTSIVLSLVAGVAGFLLAGA